MHLSCRLFAILKLRNNDKIDRLPMCIIISILIKTAYVTNFFAISHIHFYVVPFMQTFPNLFQNKDGHISLEIMLCSRCNFVLFKGNMLMMVFFCLVPRDQQIYMKRRRFRRGMGYKMGPIEIYANKFLAKNQVISGFYRTKS